MKKAFALLSVLLTLAAAAGPALAAGVEDDLNQLEERRYEAIIGKDWRALAALLEDDFFYNTASGALFSKNGLIDYLRTGVVVVHKAVREETNIRLLGDVALVTGVAHVDVTAKGEPKVLHSRYLHVWVNQGGNWRLAARQATYLPEKK